MSYFMSIDAGTGSIRAVIFDEQFNQISISQYEWEHLSEDGVSGSMNFDWENNWELTKRCIKEALTKIDKSQLKAITSSSMREGIVLYDKDKKELFAVANVDSRAKEQIRKLDIQLEKEFYKISGQTFALGAIPRIMWLKENHPNIYDKVAYISMLSDWILFKLTGEIAVEPSNAGTSGIFSLKDRNFAPFMMEKVGLKSDIFPKVIESGEVLATISSEIANEFSIPKTVVAVMGGGDVQLGTVGLGVVNDGDVAVLGGSFWQQLVNIKEPLTHPNMDIRVNPHSISGMYQAEAITFFSGIVMRWFRDVFCESEKIEAKKRGIDTYALLEELASTVPAGSYGVLPIFSDRMIYGKWYHASPSFLNLSLDTTKSSKYVLFKSLQENACVVSSINLENVFNFTNRRSEEIIFSAGASKGKLWSQTLADVSGYRVKVPLIKEATSLGGAFLSSIACGSYSNLDEIIKNFIKIEAVYEPDLSKKSIYDELKYKWSEAYKAQLELVDKKITTSMWSAF